MSHSPSSSGAPQSAARDFFVYLTAAISLYASVASLITLWFTYIDWLLPDPALGWYDPYQGVTRVAIATLIITGPLYLYFTRKVNRDVRANHSRADLPMRKWLLYLTLFIAGATMAIDAVVLVTTYLGGQVLTSAFLLKVLTVLVICSAAFWYYLRDLTGYWISHEKFSVRIGIAVGLLLAGSVLGSVAIIGSPAHVRAIRIDQERVYALESIQGRIISYYQSKQRLPKTLEELNDPLSPMSAVSTDPVTNMPYEYTQTGALGFSLCATFAKSSDIRDTQTTARNYYGIATSNWIHAQGRYCFERTIDPDLYPPFERADMKPLPVPGM
jgi:hypothetical protein